MDAAWPKPGSRIHHSFGIWPAVLNDVSEALICEEPQRLVIRPQGWPVGAAKV